MSIVTKYEVDFYSPGGALTLPCESVSDIGHVYNLAQEKTHTSGWTIKAQTQEDYYVWVNEFEAIHPVFGRVWGDFENEVFADSEEAFVDFYKNHTPEQWDYQDI